MEERLITEVMKYSFLYERDHMYYKNKYKKAKAWKEISDAMDLTAIQCQYRWKSIRDRYVRINAKTLAKEGRAASPREFRYRLLKHLDFLYDHVQPGRIQTYHKNRTASSQNVKPKILSYNEELDMEEEEEAEAETEDEYEDEEEEKQDGENEYIDTTAIPNDIQTTDDANQPDPLSSVKRKKKIQNVERKVLNVIASVSKFTEQHMTMPDSGKHYGFYKVLEPQLNALPDANQDEVKLAVINYVFNYVKKFKNKECTDSLIV